MHECTCVSFEVLECNLRPAAGCKACHSPQTSWKRCTQMQSLLPSERDCSVLGVVTCCCSSPSTMLQSLWTRIMVSTSNSGWEFCPEVGLVCSKKFCYQNDSPKVIMWKQGFKQTPISSGIAHVYLEPLDSACSCELCRFQCMLFHRDWSRRGGKNRKTKISS